MVNKFYFFNIACMTVTEKGKFVDIIYRRDVLLSGLKSWDIHDFYIEGCNAMT